MQIGVLSVQIDDDYGAATYSSFVLKEMMTQKRVLFTCSGCGKSFRELPHLCLADSVKHGCNVEEGDHECG